MDQFETYLFSKIHDYNSRLEGEHNVDIVWALDSIREELMEVLAQYTLNHKLP